MESFTLLRKIADGAFGSVYEAKLTNKANREHYPPVFAIKQAYPSENVDREVSILKSLPSHPNLLKTFQAFTHNLQTSIVMEKGMYDLAQWMNTTEYPIQERVVKAVALQVLRGLQCLHSRGLVHRDIKPSNILVTNQTTLVICDFGSAVEVSKGQQYPLEGFTRWYKCPEMLYGSRTYAYEADIWSLGCVLLEIATGQPLFGGNSEIEQLSLMANTLGDPSPTNWPSVQKMPDFGKICFKAKAPTSAEEFSKERSISLELSRFILRMVKYDCRSTAEELLLDPFVNNAQIGAFFVESQSYKLRKTLLEKKKRPI